MKELNVIPGVESATHATAPTLSKSLRDSSKDILTPSTKNRTTWGRSNPRNSWPHALFAASPLVIAPLTALCFYITLSHFDGSLLNFVKAVLDDGIFSVLYVNRPRNSFAGALAYASYLTLQALLYLVLPGPINTGQRTPAGNLLDYCTNGLLAWVVTHILYVGLCWFGFLDAGFIPRNWEGLVAAMNLSGLLLTTFAYAKAHLMPTHLDDRKFSGSVLYDFYMGIELNPRIGQNFDLKLFTNARTGMMAWTLIDLSNIAYQYQLYHHVPPSLILVAVFHTLYVLDFLYNEAWYLRTIDIAHDHYGFYLSWGCLTWVPTMYTLQSQYLGLYPTAPSSVYLSCVFAFGFAGYALFRSVNDEKDRVRRSGGKCMVWGRPAEYITAGYRTSDGVRHESLLLCCGWWGWSRHANYVGDLMLSSAMCALVGTTELLVWFYAVFMTILLVHRCLRDEERGKAKYGASWDEYCRRVPWRLVPGIW